MPTTAEILAAVRQQVISQSTLSEKRSKLSKKVDIDKADTQVTRANDEQKVVLQGQTRIVLNPFEADLPTSPLSSLPETPCKWDVFISHAGEDKGFARSLAEAIGDWGLRVWFDETELSLGDSLRRSIDHGLSASKYGIVVLSAHYFAKEWPKKELDGLLAREGTGEKIVIPVWHNVTRADVTRFSPMLADRISVYSSESVPVVAEKIVRTICRDRLSDTGWESPSIILPDGTDVVILPVRPHNEYAVGIGRHPITNSQYERFIAATGHRAPLGEHFVHGDWRGPFAPMNSRHFQLPQQPVVCVDFDDVNRYCEWVTASMSGGNEPLQSSEWAFIPHSHLWDFAATANHQMRHSKVPRNSTQGTYHQSARFPAEIDLLGDRSNVLGISDLYGNVWEWCYSKFHERLDFVHFIGWSKEFRPRLRADVELRGGGFLDDVERITPQFPVCMLENGLRTRHSDLGFRIAAMIKISRLPTGTRSSLALQSRLSSEFWNSSRLARYYRFDHEEFR